MAKSRIISLVICLLYIAAAAAGVLQHRPHSPSVIAGLGLYLLFSLACIWLGENMGSWLGSYGNPRFSHNSRFSTVVLIGWVLLITPALMLLLVLILGNLL